MIQLQVLNYILQYKDFSIVRDNNLTVEYFNNYSREFTYIQQHYNQYQTVCDIETFLNVFDDFKLINVQEPPQFLYKQLVDEYNKRKLSESFNKVREYLVVEKNVEKAMEEYMKTKDILTSNVSVEPINLITDKSRYVSYIEKTRNFNQFYISTGLKDLDKLLGGIDMEEDFGLIVARPNFGKSWLLESMAVHSVKQGLRVGWYSGEMSPNKVGYRFDTLFANINNNYITHGNISIQNEYKQYIDDLPNKVNGGSLLLLTPDMLGDYATVDDLQRFIEKENLDILYIDQVPLLKDKRGGKTDSEKFTNLATDLKKLQVLTHKPIWGAHQQSRVKTEDGSFDTTQISGSDNLGRFATVVLFIDRPKDAEDLMKLTLGKNRDGGGVGKTLSYHIDLNIGLFQYIPESDGDLSIEDDNDDIEKRYTEDINTGGEEAF